jgi:NAD+ kinase
MPLPIDLVLIRHGESEGNLVNKRDRTGDTSLATAEHRARHNSRWRLTNQGIRQAKAAGQWIKKNIPGEFDAYLTSEAVRAKETAGYLALPNAQWEEEPYLMERDHGDLDGVPKEEREKIFAANLAKRELQEYWWRPPNGETRLETGMRWDRVMVSLANRHSDHREIIVAHETMIEAGLIRRLHWTVEQFCSWKATNDPATKIHNCQVVHFSRRDPETGRIHPSVRWYRSVCPWNLALTPGKWQKIEKQLFTNTELLEQALHHPKIIADK